MVVHEIRYADHDRTLHSEKKITTVDELMQRLEKMPGDSRVYVAGRMLIVKEKFTQEATA